MTDNSKSAKRWRNITNHITKRRLALTVVASVAMLSIFHLTSLGEGDLFQTAEVVLSIIIFW